MRKGDIRSVHKPCVRSSNLAEDQEVNDKARRNVIGIPVDDAGVMQVIQCGFGHKNKCISFSLLSLGEERSNVPRHCYGISFGNVATLAGSFREFAANNELESEVVFCLRLKSSIV